jgi:hypothetical protein
MHKTALWEVPTDPWSVSILLGFHNFRITFVTNSRVTVSASCFCKGVANKNLLSSS